MNALYVCLISPELVHKQLAEKNSEHNYWGFLGLWDEILKRKQIPQESTALLVNESCNFLLNTDEARKILNHAVSTKRFVVPDKYFYDFWRQNDKAKIELITEESGLEGYKPDVVFKHDPLAGVEQMFPEAVHLGIEVGAYSRPPYNVTFYLDPLSFDCAKVVPKFVAEYKSGELLQNDLTEKMQNEITPYFEALNNNTLEYLADLKTSFDRVILLAVQYPSPRYSPYTKHKHLSDLVDDVTRYADDKTCVLICPRYHNFRLSDKDQEGLLPLLKKHRNLKLFPSELSFPYYTQMLVPHVDGVVAVTSTIGLQALMFGKPWYTSRDSFYSSLVPSYDKMAYSEFLQVSEIARAFVSWMSQYFWIQREAFLEEGFIVNYIKLFMRPGGAEATPLSEIQALCERCEVYQFRLDRLIMAKYRQAAKGSVPIKLVTGPFR